MKSIKGIFATTLSLAVLSIMSLPHSAEAQGAKLPRSQFLIAHGHITDLEGNPLPDSANVMFSVYKTNAYDGQSGNPWGSITGTPEALILEGEGGTLTATLIEGINWVTGINLMTFTPVPEVVMPLTQANIPDLPADFDHGKPGNDDKSLYEVTTFMGSVPVPQVLPDGSPAGTGFLSGITHIDFRCVFITRISTEAGPGMGAPVYSSRRFYALY